MKIPNDVIIQAGGNGEWILYNVFTQNTLAVSTDSLNFLSKINSGVEIEDIIEKNKDKKFLVWKIERFSNFDGLLADPTRRIRDSSDWPKPLHCSATDLFKKLSESVDTARVF